jgi:hypothetical protein
VDSREPYSLNRAGPPTCNRRLAPGGHLALRLAHRCAARAAPRPPPPAPRKGAAWRASESSPTPLPPPSLTIPYKFIANA